MKHIDKQIEAVVKTKNRAKSDLIDLQNQMANAIKHRTAGSATLGQSDCAGYFREINELYQTITTCEIVIGELIILKQMNEGK